MILVDHQVAPKTLRHVSHHPGCRKPILLPQMKMIVLYLQALWRRASSLPGRRRPCRRSPKLFTSGPALLHFNSRDCSQAAKGLCLRPETDRIMAAQNYAERYSRSAAPSMILSHHDSVLGCGFARLRSLCLFVAILLPITAVRAQDTNPPPPQYSTTPIHQLSAFNFQLLLCPLSAWRSLALPIPVSGLNQRKPWKRMKSASPVCNTASYSRARAAI